MNESKSGPESINLMVDWAIDQKKMHLNKPPSIVHFFEGRGNLLSNERNSVTIVPPNITVNANNRFFKCPK